ncbi:uncharacterized protein LOC142789483 [Rhipicephalus microplus]|uniref:uncharacterized protein LOC142789483 n=1 Tax=Rhipicephalus microplus TaxID=6941 RepID=UPI003F6AF794
MRELLNASFYVFPRLPQATQVAIRDGHDCTTDNRHHCDDPIRISHKYGERRRLHEFTGSRTSPPLKCYHSGGVFESEFLASDAGTSASGAETESNNGCLLESLCRVDFCTGAPVCRLLGLVQGRLVPRRARNPGIVYESMKTLGKGARRAAASPVPFSDQ